MNTITIDRALVEQALEALEKSVAAMRGLYGGWRCESALKQADTQITALRSALAEPVQEPGFWGRVAARQAIRIKQLEPAAQQALEALELEMDTRRCRMAIAALRAALAQQPEPVQEPVAWIHTDPDKPRVRFLEWREDEPGYRGRWIKTPLYTAPPQRKPLMSDKDQGTTYVKGYGYVDTRAVRAIERAHGVGEQP